MQEVKEYCARCGKHNSLCVCIGHKASGRRRSGLAVVEKYGVKHMSNLGKIGGSAVVEKYGAEHMSEIGAIGGNAVIEKYGNEHMSKIASRRIRPKRKSLVLELMDRVLRLERKMEGK